MIWMWKDIPATRLAAIRGIIGIVWFMTMMISYRELMVLSSSSMFQPVGIVSILDNPLEPELVSGGHFVADRETGAG